MGLDNFIADKREHLGAVEPFHVGGTRLRDPDAYFSRFPLEMDSIVCNEVYDTCKEKCLRIILTKVRDNGANGLSRVEKYRSFFHWVLPVVMNKRASKKDLDLNCDEPR